jgi:hypothetical protein
LVQVLINRDAVPFAGMWGPVIAKFAVAVARNFEFTFKVVDPPADERRCIRRKIGCKNFYFIQFLPRGKDRDLGGKAKEER